MQLGLDLGGSQIKALVWDEVRGVAVRQAEHPTTRSGPADTVAGLAEVAARWCNRFPEVRGVGITVPGTFDAEGRAYRIPNIPGDWTGEPVTAPVAAATNRPVRLINDARAFGVAEHRHGAAVGAKIAAGMVLGTGIGGVLIIDGQVFPGPSGAAGELGHLVLDPDGDVCGCGAIGCLETLARAEVLAARAGAPTVKAAAEAAEAGDERAKAAFEETGRWIAVAFATTITLQNPSVGFHGGGVMRAGNLLLDPIRRHVPRHVAMIDPATCAIVQGKLGPWAGAIGAAAVAPGTP
jgi:glucokinase